MFHNTGFSNPFYFTLFQVTSGSRRPTGSPYSSEKSRHRSSHVAKDPETPVTSTTTKKRHCAFPQRRSVLKSSQSFKVITSFLFWFLQENRLCARGSLFHHQHHHRNNNNKKKTNTSASLHRALNVWVD